MLYCKAVCLISFGQINSGDYIATYYSLVASFALYLQFRVLCLFRKAPATHIVLDSWLLHLLGPWPLISTIYLIEIGPQTMGPILRQIHVRDGS